MKVEETELAGVKLIKPEIFEDYRGEYVETWNEKLYTENGINVKFIQDDISVSYQNVLRGIHGDAETWKLVSCLYGRFYLVVLNQDESSPQYNKWISFTLSDKNRSQVLIPPKFGNGHLVLSKVAIFHYKQSTYYNPKKQFTRLWNDPALRIWWPIKNPILSVRDECGKFAK